MVHVPLIFLSEWCEFPLARCLAEKKYLRTAGVWMLKSRSWPEMLPFSLCNKKRLAIWHMTGPLFPTTLDSVLRHGEVGRTKELSAPFRVFIDL